MPLALLVSRTCRALVAGGRMAAARPRAVLRPLCSAAGDGPAATWASLGLTEDLVAACENLDLPSPTPIQRLAIPAVTGGEDVLFAAETGSGKTLAYLLPVFSKLKAEEFAAGDDAKNLRRERRPRALVLVPTRELAAQVTAVAKSIAHVAKLGVRGCYGGSDGVGKQRKQLAGSFDVLVATPGRFRALWGGGGVHVSRTNVVVIDEVDTMLEQGFGADLAEILAATARTGRGYGDDPDAAPGAQVVATTATLTKAVRRTFCDAGSRDSAWAFLPELRTLESPQLHRAVASATHVAVDVTGGGDKLNDLDGVLAANREGKALVFCNTVASCRAVEHALRERSRDPELLFCYHGDMNSREREASLIAFRAAGDSGVLVATDLAARGLDVPDVGHVVMFDFPRNPVDYLHRSGRTARAGAKGRVTALVAKADRVLATAVARAVAAGEPLDGLSSDKKAYAPGGTHAPKANPNSAKRVAARDLAAARRGGPPNRGRGQLRAGGRGGGSGARRSKPKTRRS